MPQFVPDAVGVSSSFSAVADTQADTVVGTVGRPVSTLVTTVDSEGLVLQTLDNAVDTALMLLSLTGLAGLLVFGI